MRPFHNTPGLVQSSPPAPPKLAAQELIDKLEGQYRDYQDDCNKGYCSSDPQVHKDFRAKLQRARDLLAKPSAA